MSRSVIRNWLIVVFLLPYAEGIRAQISCPVNIDFEQGLGNWNYYTGTCCPIATPNLTGPVTNRHTLTTGNGVDPFGGFPVVAPGGGIHSLKLGNSNVNAQAERATYTFTVPAGVNNYLLTYRYAVVFQDPQHQPADQPRFEVKAYNALTNVVLPCAQHTYVATSALPGFSRSAVDTSVWYHPWTLGTINLSGYAGQTIRVEFSSGDCALGAHFGYGYVDMNCSLFKLNYVSCTPTPATTLSAPPGYQYYTWMDATYSSILGSGQQVSVNTPATNTTYHVILTPYNNSGCIDTLTTQILVSGISVQATPDTFSCAGDSVHLSASTASIANPVTYAWSPAAGLSCTSCAQPVAVPSGTVTYVVAVQDTNGCTASDSVTIKVSNPQVSITKTDIACNGDTSGSATALVTGATAPTRFSWSTNPVQVTPGIAQVPAGTYTVWVSDSFCTRAAQVQIMQPLPLLATLNTVAPSCNGMTNGSAGSIVSGGTVPYHYLWSTAPTDTLNNVSGLGAGSYWLSVRDSAGCSDTLQFSITQPSPVTVVVSSSGNILCNNGNNGWATAVAAGGTPPYSFSWNTSPAQNTAAATNLIAGSYTITATDAKGCSDTAQVSLIQPPPLVAAVTQIDPVTCATALNGKAVVTASGGKPPYSYTWNTTPVQTTAAATHLAAGNYVCTVTDSNGCTTTVNASISYTHPIVVAIAPPAVMNCYGDSTGALTVSASGGYPPYGYSWNTLPPRVTPTVTGLYAGTYTVTITDSAGCSTNATATITEQPEIQIDASAEPACPGIPSGSAAVAATGGVPGYSYLWNTVPQQTGTTVSNLQSGPYFIRVTDSKGCSKWDTVFVDSHPAAHIEARGDTLVCKGSPVRLYAAGAESYVWSPGASLSCSNCATPMANPAQTTTYTVVGTDTNGCKDTGRVVLTVLHRVSVGVDSAQAICEGASVRLQASGGQRYRWIPSTGLSDNESANPLASPLVTTTYQVIIEENECFRDTLSQTVFVEPLPTVDLGPDIRALYGQSLYLHADTSHAVGLKWTPAEGLNCDECDNPVALVSKSIIYVVKAKNRLGCLAEDELVISLGCDQSTVYMANTFTPNGDGLNDRYFPKGSGVEKIISFMIFDRWGEKLFEARDFDANSEQYGWDGTYRSLPMRADVYVYLVEARCADGGTVHLKGDLTLYR